MQKWITAGLEAKRAGLLKENYPQGKIFFERLAEKLQKDLKALDASIESQEFLVLPGTKERLVSRLAERRKIKEVLKLIEV